jgi:hypothetical protein
MDFQILVFHKIWHALHDDHYLSDRISHNTYIILFLFAQSKIPRHFFRI